ncbi:MAG: ABC transporter substrate-binding protein, partial [Anaerolineales bacterium]
MKRLTTLMVMLMVASMLISACAPAAPTEEPAAPTEVPAVEPTEAPPEPPDEPAEAGIYLGMTAEELMAAGYVVIAPGETIRIGQSTGLTGPIPDPGLDIAQAAELAVDDLNAAGGFEGHDFELVTEDGACDGDAATIVGNKFAADPSIVAIQGGMCTGETLALVPILSAARIPFVSASSTNPAVTSEECDVCNRVALSDKLQADVDADYIYNVLGVRTIALMHD